ncbi:hypothetical protein OH76DRAFT_1367415, partial [Lentinus brumalis]
VTRDITDAILKATASGGSPAVYRSQEEQERRLVEAYTRWAEKGNVFSAAAEKANQLAHVKKGCLARPRNDVPSDGSRIEGSHGKGWNSIQRSQASGVESFTYLGHDFVLRRNFCIDFSSGSPSAFVASTCGSHHVHLVNAITLLWDDMLDAKRKLGALPSDLSPLPLLKPAASGETFVLMKMSAETAAHYTFVKEEPADDLLDLASHADPASVLGEMGIDPSLVNLLPPTALPPPGTSSSTLALAASPSRSSAAHHSKSTLLSSSLATSKPAPRTTSGPPSSRKRRADDSDGAIAFHNHIKPAFAAELASQAPIDSKVPPAKKARLHVPGSNVAGTSKGKAKDKSGSSSAFFVPRGRPPSTVGPAGGYQPLCLPILKITGLTPSQQVFSIATGLDIRSLHITKGEKDAFYLFMNLRKKHQWASFNMTPRTWVQAASIYNIAVEKKNTAENRSMVCKTPRALFEKLGEVEVIIMGRINRGDYKCNSGSTQFWYEHCHAVPLRVMKASEVAAPGDATRKGHTCSRCKMIMYPGGEGSSHNHKRGVCSDGVRSTTRKIDWKIDGETVKIEEEPPQWPQPGGIFKKGNEFHVKPFINTVEEMYDRLVVRGDVDTEQTMEYLALTSLLQSHLRYIPGTVDSPPRALFKLFEGLELCDCPKEVPIVKLEGARYIHLNYLCRQAAGVPLQMEEDAQAPIASGSGSSSSW